MKKTILIFAILVIFTGCSFLNKVQKHCKTKIETTPEHNFIFCALCDSNATEIFKKAAPEP